MELIRRLVPALAVICCVVVSPAILGQTTETARPAVDVRAMLPSVAEPAPAAPPAGTGLTRNQRKDEALKAREEGALKPAGEGAEFREDAPSRLAVKARAEPAPPAPAPAPMAAPAQAEARALPKKLASNASHAPKKSAVKVPATRKAAQPRDPSNI